MNQIKDYGKTGPGCCETLSDPNCTCYKCTIDSLRHDIKNVQEELAVYKDVVSRNLDRLAEVGLAPHPNDSPHILTGAITLVLERWKRLKGEED